MTSNNAAHGWPSRDGLNGALLQSDGSQSTVYVNVTAIALGSRKGPRRFAYLGPYDDSSGDRPQSGADPQPCIGVGAARYHRIGGQNPSRCSAVKH